MIFFTMNPHLKYKKNRGRGGGGGGGVKVVEGG